MPKESQGRWRNCLILERPGVPTTFSVWKYGERREEASLPPFSFPPRHWKDGIVVNWIGEGCEQSRIWGKNRILVWEMFRKSGRELIYKVDIQGRGVGWRYKLGNY